MSAEDFIAATRSHAGSGAISPRRAQENWRVTYERVVE